MDEITLKEFEIGTLSNNSYLIYSQKTKNSFLIDCPSPTDQIREFIDKNKLKLLFIALTHAHFDHIAGLNDFSQDVFIDEAEKSYLKDPNLNRSSFFLAPLSIKRSPKVYQGDSLAFEGRQIEVIHTPGHSPGGVSLRLGKWLFSGDALFFRTVGRTDIPDASAELLIKSINEKLMVLPEDTIVYPGHGPKTRIGEELKNNPYLA
ncbi:MAG: MBL fold metallo-hydrolase [Candidatus Omnitrophica bacterium]|nr:MBL fold metallo-hydrolase [Candidatus Omnitrophota bacterium]